MKKVKKMKWKLKNNQKKKVRSLLRNLKITRLKVNKNLKKRVKKRKKRKQLKKSKKPIHRLTMSLMKMFRLKSFSVKSILTLLKMISKNYLEVVVKSLKLNYLKEMMDHQEEEDSLNLYPKMQLLKPLN